MTNENAFHDHQRGVLPQIISPSICLYTEMVNALRKIFHLQMEHDRQMCVSSLANAYGLMSLSVESIHNEEISTPVLRTMLRNKPVYKTSTEKAGPYRVSGRSVLRQKNTRQRAKQIEATQLQKSRKPPITTRLKNHMSHSRTHSHVGTGTYRLTIAERRTNRMCFMRPQVWGRRRMVHGHVTYTACNAVTAATLIC